MPRGRRSAGGGNEKETRGIRRAERGKRRCTREDEERKGKKIAGRCGVRGEAREERDNGSDEEGKKGEEEQRKKKGRGSGRGEDVISGSCGAVRRGATARDGAGTQEEETRNAAL